VKHTDEASLYVNVQQKQASVSYREVELTSGTQKRVETSSDRHAATISATRCTFAGMTVKETRSKDGLLTVLGVVGGLMGSALLSVLLNPPTLSDAATEPIIVCVCVCSSVDWAVQQLCPSYLLA
jgi:hypothetical protein